ncbi:MAG: N-acetylmuramoyl-L-alanine amidase [Pseudomonadota bacterium]
MNRCEDALARLCEPAAEVSAHYLISESGAAWQLVDEQMRAWHAGAGRWGDVTDINSHSIGIELCNTMHHPFPEPQMAVLDGLLRDILTRHSIQPGNVIAHSDMAPGRKSDPGARFDWARLERLGLAGQRGSGAGPDAPDAQLFRKIARAAGYTADVSDATLLQAVRLRYRPQARGPLAPEDFAPLMPVAPRS